MAIPQTPLIWDDPMDPSDLVDYVADLTSLLAEDETIASYTVTVPSDAALAGLRLGTNLYDTTISGNSIRVWLSLDTPSDTRFDGAGVSLPVEFTIMTTSIPQRRRQRTALVKVQQR